MVVIGVAAYMVSQPKQGSVEWHKRRYLRAFDLTYHLTLKDRTVDFCRRVAGLPAAVRPLPDLSSAKGLSRNWAALRKKGFVRVEIVYLNSRTSAEVLRVLPRKLAGTPAYHQKLTGVAGGNWGGRQIIIVDAPASDVARWIELIWHADVPETK